MQPASNSVLSVLDPEYGRVGDTRPGGDSSETTSPPASRWTLCTLPNVVTREVTSIEGIGHSNLQVTYIIIRWGVGLVCPLRPCWRRSADSSREDNRLS